MLLPPEMPLAEVAALPAGTTALWASPSVAARARARFPSFAAVTDPGAIPASTTTLLAVGAGAFLDQAKAFRRHRRPDLRLVAIPSLWGSGAEASRVCVRDAGGRKAIEVDDALRPDALAFWPELADTVPAARRDEAGGDAWAHAYEAFLSPLATDDLRRAAATLLREMQAGADAAAPLAWFRWSARACALQASSGVGLIHGIAHVLEGPLRAADPGGDWHHAGLCNLLLWPVHRFNCTQAAKVADLAAATGFDAAALGPVFRARFQPGRYARLLPALTAAWTDILRDRCTRMNGVLARPAHLAFFTGTDFGATA